MKSIMLLLLFFVLACSPEKGEMGPKGDSIVGPPGRDADPAIPIVGPPGQDSIAELIDPCGDEVGYDEVLIRLTDGRLLAYFESGGNRFLSVLPPGSYRTTDSSSCAFTVDSLGNVTDENGNLFPVN